MRIRSKRVLTLWLTLCMCLSPLSLAPVNAHAATEIKNATTTLEFGDPVVMMEVAQNAVRASGTGYHLVSATWLDSAGKAETATFKKGSYTLVIRLEADKGYVFAADAKGYINNSNSGITTERSEDGSQLTLSRAYNATVWAPIPVKHPGPETVKEGGWCSFVVSGMYVGSYEWILESPDGKTVPASKLTDYFPNVTQEGDGTSKIKLYNIPYEMNGWKIYCTEWSVDKLSFTNTNSTTLTVTSDNPPSPTPAPTETPAPAEGTEATPAEETEATPAEGTEAAAGTEAETGTEAGTETESGEEPEATEEVVHHFSQTWRYDEQTHWHACEDEGCDVIDGQALHTMEWTVTREADRDAPGEEEGVCTVCGYRAVRELPIDEEAIAQSDAQIFRFILIGLAALLLLSIIILIVQAVRRANRYR